MYLFSSLYRIEDMFKSIELVILLHIPDFNNIAYKQESPLARAYSPFMKGLTVLTGSGKMTFLIDRILRSQIKNSEF